MAQFFSDKATFLSARLHSSVFAELTGTLKLIDDFLLLYAPVLKPDCHLSLCQIGLGGYPPPFVFGDEFIGSVLPFQFLELHLCVWHTLLSPPADTTVATGDV